MFLSFFYSLVILLSLYIISEIVDGQFLKSLDNISKYLKLSPSVAGATLLAFGTSAPEISTALVALFILGDSPATGVGTIVGSAIFQILVVIGFTAIVKTSYLNWKPVIRDSLFYILSVVLLYIFIQDGKLVLFESTILVLTYAVYLIMLFFWSRYIKEDDPDPIELETQGLSNSNSNLAAKIFKKITLPIDKLLGLIPDPEKKPAWTVPVFVLSLGIIGLACYFMVDAAVIVSDLLGIDQAIVALTILAGGTSVPELISSAVVSRQGRGDMAIANAIGSNIFDILMSLGLPLLFYNLLEGDLTNFGSQNITSSVILLLATLVAVLTLLISQKFKFSRWMGMLLILTYVVYVGAAYLGYL